MYSFANVRTAFLFLLLSFEINICTADDDQYDIENEIDEPSTDKVQESTFQMPDEKWTTIALKDIAYYLRNHKFNEWDRRYYLQNSSGVKTGYFGAFPAPPLRSLHWKVKESCFNNFYKCIIYLHGIISTAPLQRNDDTSVIMNENTVHLKNNSIENLDVECRKALSNSEKNGLPFDSPLEKFQWRTTASYYMCWYTMLGTPALSMLGESCDNYANCLDPIYGNHNSDIRSDDRLSFSCAKYSFCPDPCCPIKHLNLLTQCNDYKGNPCYIENAGGDSSKRRCNMDRRDNQNLHDIIANRWNVSCYCKENGFGWKSRYGMCVDNNECVTGEHSCNSVTEDCLNLPGTFKCVCKWGFALDESRKKCMATNMHVQLNKKCEEDAHNSLIGLSKIMLDYFGFRK